MYKGTYFRFVLLINAIFMIKNVQCINEIINIEEIKSILQESNNNANCVSAIFENANFLQFLDASGKIPSGIFDGNFYGLGSFDSCYGTKISVNNVEMDGKYCLNSIPIDITQLMTQNLKKNVHLQTITPITRIKRDDENTSSSSAFQFRFSYCVPSVCHAKNLQNISDTIVNFLNISFRPIFREEWCYSKATDPELSNGAIATIVFLSVIFGIVFISSVYEYYLNYYQKKPIHEICLAFSAISNGKKLITSTSSRDQLLCLNGIRALSMVWVFIFHDYMSLVIGPVQNSFERLEMWSSKDNMWLVSAPISVDTFLAIGGLVTAYSFLRANDKGAKFNIPLYYLHRYLRLTPAVAVMILFHYNLLIHMGNGPLWNNIKETLADPCQNNWWSGLLYLQNFINVPDMCVPQSWYLSVDFQLFLLSPIILYPLSKWPKVAYGILGLLVPVGIIVPAVITYEHQISGIFGGTGNNPDAAASVADYVTYYYYQTHARFGPYIIGMIFGIIVYKMKKNNLMPRKTKKNQIIASCLWLVALTGVVACVYGGADLLVSEYDRIAATFYNGLNRNAWALSVCLVVILCVADFGGAINDFLSIPIFQFLSKLSYSIYLVHYSYLYMMNASLRVPFYSTHWNMVHVFWGHFMYYLLLATILYLCFESPVIILEKYLLGNSSSKSRNVKSENKKLEV